MPKIASSILWPIVVLIIAFGAFFLKPWETKTTETVSVTAAGTVDVTPDVAKITASIESTNPNIDVARKENEQKVALIVAKLKALNVDEKDIKTQNISAGKGYEVFTPRSTSDEVQTQIYPAPPKPNTNNFSTSLEITIRSFETTDEVIAALTQNGATNLYGPNLTLSNDTMEEAKSQARAKAVDLARKKAEDLAKLSGRGIGKAVKISEQGDYGYPVPMMARAEGDLVEKASLVQPGQNQVSINLAVDFALK